MLGADIVVIQTNGFFLGNLQYLARMFRKPI
jgi:hypothetical protein